MPPPAELSAYGSILVSPILISQIADTISPAAAGPPCLFGRAVYRTGRAPAVPPLPSANRATKQCLRGSLALVMLTSELGTLAAPTPLPVATAYPRHCHCLASSLGYRSYARLVVKSSENRPRRPARLVPNCRLRA
ncbi:hypothetical protein POSPLADRAFT_1055639 [Postia placenta MAD-698-R-SB12]|uniref:Uncharacterized protein n=1 Tax=Postia placenta MAD-698-R-SB12 TaxID=670580 RepID=A0A1X6N4S0_9APHY|nr:hypothetical protein POSPLADRAFT_1055639 [Postia placenta MAD-698-R-SB12]OSX63594.1 hypothetical protein POSPLADRAFT_1055639 [Postia placenta MAD-698-R-SB12]